MQTMHRKMLNAISKKEKKTEHRTQKQQQMRKQHRQNKCTTLPQNNTARNNNAVKQQNIISHTFGNLRPSSAFRLRFARLPDAPAQRAKNDMVKYTLSEIKKNHFAESEK